MASGVSVEIIGQQALRSKLGKIAREGGDTLKLHRLIGIKVLREIQLGFRKERQPGGRKWQPLAKSTIFARRKKSSKILQDTGSLRQSFTFKARKGFVVIGSAKKTAGFHKEGWKGGPISPKKRGGVLVFPSERGRVIKRGKGAAKKGAVGRGGVKLAFVRGTIQHPGFPARPMLPTRRFTNETARKVTDQYLKGVAQRGNR